jgi:Na+/proline symporter
MILFNSIIFVIFIIFIISLGWWHTRHVKTETSYLLAGRSTKLFPLVATLVMTEFNTATLLAFSSIGYLASWWGLSLGLVFLIGLLFYALTVAKKWKRFNGVSVAHYFSERYSPAMGHFVATVLLLAMFGFSAVYLKSLALLFSPLLPHASLWLISGALTVLIVLMICRGGLVSIIHTDVVSFCLVVILFPSILFFTAHMPNHAPVSALSFTQMQQALPIKFLISLIVLTMFSYIVAPWYGQKIVAAKNAKVARWAVIIAAMLIAVLYGIGILATAILRNKGVQLSNPTFAIPYILKHNLPSYTQGIAYAVLFSIGATTLSGVWNAMVTLLVGKLNSTQGMRRTYSLSIICVIIVYVLANIISNSILNDMILANIPIVALSFALLAGFYWPRVTRAAAYSSIVFGVFWGLGCYLYIGAAGIYTWYWAVYGVPLIFATGIAVSLLQKKKKRL